MYLHIRK